MNADEYFSEFRGKHVTLLGFGVSNRPLLAILLEYNAFIKICDKRTIDKLGLDNSILDDDRVTFSLGDDYLEDIYGDIIFKTPGMRCDIPQIVKAANNGARITSEMEEFLSICPCKVFGITGSDGKTTTSTLIYNFLSENGYRCHLGGNIGSPLLPRIFDMKKEDVVVVELSSFQLHSMHIPADIAVIKNVTPNHLDWHIDMNEYVESKKHIYLGQSSEGLLVLNKDDKISSGFSADASGHIRWFSMFEEVPEGAWLGPDRIIRYKDSFGRVSEIMNADCIKIKGEHNIENYLTAIAAVYDYVSSDLFRKVAESFNGVEHRMEFVREFNGVSFYNDAIATTPTRTIACLKAQKNKIVLIAGGYDKHVPFEPLVPYIIDKVKCLVLYGATSDKICNAVKNSSGFFDNEIKIVRAYSMEDAVSLAYHNAESGDCVYLSPASASFDRYPNFEFCGKDFKEKVNNLQ